MYNMKKFKFLILMLCSIMSFASCSDSDKYSAEQKTKESSQELIDKVAINFAQNVNNNDGTRCTNNANIAIVQKDSLTLNGLTRGVDGEATKVYAVSMTGDNGSIIIAQQGDDVRPLVYFPNEQSIDLNKLYNDNYDESDISYLAQGVTYNYTEDGILIPSDKASNAKIVERLEPKCKVYWNQRSPYNKYCFTSKNEQALAGCVAIAGAQALTVLRPSVPEITSWDEVVKEYPTTKAQDEIAKLVSRIGKDAGMKYGTGSSGTSTSKLSPIFAKYGIKDYDAGRAVDVLKTKHGVIVVSGYRARHGWGPTKHYVDGHALLADGYIRFSGDKYYYFHVNYGCGKGYKDQKVAYLLTSNKDWDKEHANDIYGMCFPKEIKYYTYAYEREKNW